MEATDGIAFPVPRSPFSESGAFALDVTKSLHYSILVMWPRAREARSDGYDVYSNSGHVAPRA